MHAHKQVITKLARPPKEIDMACVEHIPASVDVDDLGAGRGSGAARREEAHQMGGGEELRLAHEGGWNGSCGLGQRRGGRAVEGNGRDG